MSWYEETSKNNNNNNNDNNDNNENNAVNTSSADNTIENEEERTVNAKGYIDADDPANRAETYENAYDRPFEGTAREELTPVVSDAGNDFEAAHDSDNNDMSDGDETKASAGENNGKAGKNGNDRPPYYEVKVKRKKKGMTFGKVIAACLICSLGLGTGIGAGYGISRSLSGNGGTTYDGVLTTTASAVSSVKSSSATDAISSVYSAVVSITTTTQGTASYGFYSIPYQAVGAGSGVIFSEDESLVYVATNEHVIDGAQNIAIAFDDADETIPASVVGYDSTTDLSVLSVEKADLEAQGIKNVTIATFDDSGNITLGEPVIAIGNSLGEGKTTTGGMISSENKTVSVEGKELEVIQTDAAINPGNSGGALIDYSGAVIGINTAKTFTTSSGSDAEGVGYAIPSSIAVPILKEIVETGSVEKPYLGITGQDITDQLSELYRLPVGVLVTSVLSGGSAEEAGIQEGDVIVSYNGKSVMDMDSLVAYVAESNVGDEVKIGIVRNGDTSVEVTAVLGNINSNDISTGSAE